MLLKASAKIFGNDPHKYSVIVSNRPTKDPEHHRGVDLVCSWAISIHNFPFSNPESKEGCIPCLFCRLRKAFTNENNDTIPGYKQVAFWMLASVRFYATILQMLSMSVCKAVLPPRSLKMLVTLESVP